MTEREKVTTIELTMRQRVLVRVALMGRMDRLKQAMKDYNPHNDADARRLEALLASYNDTRAMLVEGGVLAIKGYDAFKEPSNG